MLKKSMFTGRGNEKGGRREEREKPKCPNSPSEKKKLMKENVNKGRCTLLNINMKQKERRRQEVYERNAEDGLVRFKGGCISDLEGDVDDDALRGSRGSSR